MRINAKTLFSAMIAAMLIGGGSHVAAFDQQDEDAFNDEQSYEQEDTGVEVETEEQDDAWGDDGDDDAWGDDDDDAWGDEDDDASW